MRITVTAYVESEGSQDCDVVVPQVVEALRRLGHEVNAAFIHADVMSFIERLRECRPELVFNLVESFGNDMTGGLVAVTGILDLLQLAYTGAGPGEIYLQEDKALAKKLLAYEGLLYPHFATFTQTSDFETGGNLRMPLLVKPLRNDASIGIDAKTSLVSNTRELMERVLSIHETLNDDALAEEFIEGREFYVGVLGNSDMVPLPPIEMDFSGMPDGTPNILDARAKFDEKSPEYRGTRAVVAKLDDQMTAQLQKAAITACRSVRVRDYGRVDMRLTPSGEIYVIEVNANCYLEKSSEFAMSAAAADIDYQSLIDWIVKAAIERHRAK